MALIQFKRVVLFGGSGFVGGHLAAALLRRGLAKSIVLADIRTPTRPLADARIEVVRCDVRDPIESQLLSEAPDLIVNLAAVHREPGHETAEYFETNLRGASNVCHYARVTNCERLVFTSSIAVYGPTETEKDESSLPVPVGPYGASKLVAEHIHREWMLEDARRRLVVIRPGVIFGPGEGGNVTRLVKAISRGYFVYLGNHDVRKAGGYVGELCNSIIWALGEVTASERCLLFNFSMDPPPRLEEFVDAIARVAGRRTPSRSVPYRAVLAASYAAQAVSTVTGFKQPLHPTRARKLARSNHITAGVLKARGYSAEFTLETALREWMTVEPLDWVRR